MNLRFLLSGFRRERV